MSMPRDVMDKYREIFLTKITTSIDAYNNKNMRNFTAADRLYTRGPALPENLDMKNLMLTKRTMNTLMKSYIDRVRANPQQYIR